MEAVERMHSNKATPSHARSNGLHPKAFQKQNVQKFVTSCMSIIRPIDDSKPCTLSSLPMSVSRRGLFSVCEDLRTNERSDERNPREVPQEKGGGWTKKSSKDFANAVDKMSRAGYKGEYGNHEVPEEDKIKLDALYMQATSGDYGKLRCSDKGTMQSYGTSRGLLIS
ncbi:unnamed protein product [Strongylus vulgaris]|uniref:Uncharacterized protein n=1 Tax=Strongylus vulgaris TaxID=40348 RepID=A0A3P7JL09_STRVU|nr:unnamed protein product [Strongylus vulgaris]